MAALFLYVFEYFIGKITVCFDKIVMISLWNKLWAQHFGEICKRNKYQFSQSFRGMGFSVRLLLAKKHESGKIYPVSNRVII